MDLEPWDPLEHPARIEVRRQESDDSDAEGGLGNVTRVVLRPPGHSGKAKRGHLCFDASFETGNLGRVDFVSEFEYDLFIRPDTCNPRYRLWFNFVVDNVRTDQRVIFNLVNLCKVKTLFRDGMTPLVRTSSRTKWQRLPQKYVYYHKSPEHRNHYILSFAFAFDREEDVYQFSFSYPYSYSRCQAHLTLVEQKELPYVKRESLASSLQSRRVEALTVTSILAGTTAGKKPKLVVIMARSHPGESPTSFVTQDDILRGRVVTVSGLMDFMVSSHAVAAALRDHVVIKILPMVNPDGVFLGNHRCSLMGYDLNRHWNQVSPWSHPTLNAVKNYLLDLDASKMYDLDMVIDLHAHSSLSGAFIYGNSYDDVYRFERHILFPKLMAHNAEDFNPANTMYNRDASKGGTARRHLCEVLRPSVNTYTVEVSLHGYTQQSSNNFVAYNEDGYFRFGRNLIRTLFEYYRVTGIIPANILAPPPTAHAEPEKKPQRRKSRSRSRSQPRSKGKKGNLKSEKSQQEPAMTPSGDKVEAHDKEMSRGSRLEHTSSTDSTRMNDKTVVQLSQLTREARRESSESSGEETYSNEQFSGGTHSFGRSNKRHSVSAAHLQQVPLTTATGEPSGPSDSEPEQSPGGRNVRVKRKSVEVRNQIRAKTATYKTFDFSTINSIPSNYYHLKNVRSKRSYRSAKMNACRGRKIGGGGIIGNCIDYQVRQRKMKAEKGWHSEPERTAPFLTIIDFNTLIHKSLTDAVTSGLPWKGNKINSKRWLLANATHLVTQDNNLEAPDINIRINPSHGTEISAEKFQGVQATVAITSVTFPLEREPGVRVRICRRRSIASVSDFSPYDGNSIHPGKDETASDSSNNSDSNENQRWKYRHRRRRHKQELVQRCLRTALPVSPMLQT